MTIDLTPLLQALFALLATIITVKIIPWIKSRTTAEQQKTLHTAVQVAVYAAEQVYGAGRGNEKLAYAQTYLLGKGYTVDIEVIEAAVRGMTEALKEKPPAKVKNDEPVNALPDPD